MMPSLLAFEHHLLKHMRQDGLLSSEDRVLVAVSGGPDSVALLQALYAWRESLGLALAVVHCDHGLRGRESMDDAVFVERLARKLALPFFCKSLDLPHVLRERRGESVQAVARARRYACLWEVAGEWGATKVAIGHTQDDQIETVLMWMLRGSGLAGLSGMPAQRHPCLIRPFLRVSRSDLLRYLEEKGCEFRVDSSNASPKYMRNRLRHELVPLLKTFNPRVVSMVSNQAAILREEHRYLDDVAKAMLESVTVRHATECIVLSHPRFLAAPVPIQRRMIVRMADSLRGRPGTLRFEAVETILRHVVHGISGSTARFGHLGVVREYDWITFSAIPVDHARRAQPDLSCLWSFPGLIRWPVTGQTLEGTVRAVETVSIPWNDSAAYLDADQFSHDLVVRSWRPGDYFFPYGMGGRRKKIQDFFSDTKVRQTQRHTIPLVVAPEGILWIGGYRADHRFRVTQETQRVAVVRMCSA